jgi:hypothetical protein
MLFKFAAVYVCVRSGSLDPKISVIEKRSPSTTCWIDGTWCSEMSGGREVVEGERKAEPASGMEAKRMCVFAGAVVCIKDVEIQAVGAGWRKVDGDLSFHTTPQAWGGQQGQQRVSCAS